MKNDHKIVRTEVTPDYIQVTLSSGVRFVIASNPNYLHVHLSYINVDVPIAVVDQAANQLNIKYEPILPNG